jgi:predicted regulator of Ras-like GTPase activity (Roadblock/LC7/MglB family)
MDRAESLSDPKAFLDRICESVAGVKKAYISDSQGVILAESSGESDDDAISLVRYSPAYFERLSHLSFGEMQSLVVEAEDASAVILVSTPLVITFLCEESANFALLTEIPNEMRDILVRLKSFLESA